MTHGPRCLGSLAVPDHRTDSRGPVTSKSEGGVPHSTNPPIRPLCAAKRATVRARLVAIANGLGEDPRRRQGHTVGAVDLPRGGAPVDGGAETGSELGATRGG